MKILKKIETLKKELASLQPIDSKNEQRLWKKFRLEWNYNSNHIEGNTLTYGQTKLLLIFDQTTGNHSFREYEEMKAHDVAIQLIKESAGDKERPLTQSFIRKLNEIILVRPFWNDAITPNGHPTRRLIKIGEYKTQPNSVILQNGEIFEYASPEETPIKMRELIDWYREVEEKNEMHPVELAAKLHYKFVRIHPFDDGNGRVSRLLMNYVLLKNGLPPVIIKTADKKNYLMALNKADAGNIEAFVKYIAENLIWSLDLNVKAAKGENIEKEGDLDKELAILEKKLTRRPKNLIKKSIQTILKTYSNQIAPLYHNLISEIAKFDKFYNNSVLNLGINMQSKQYFKENYEQEFFEELKNYSQLNPKLNQKVNNLIFDYYYEGFIDKKTIFNYKSSIDIVFRDYYWEIKLDNDFTIKLTYQENLSQEHIQKTIDYITKEHLEYIKRKKNFN